MSPRAADSATAPGTVIAGHRIITTLESGGSGGAFRAEAPDGSMVVLRVERSAGGRVALTRFLDRAERLDGVSHPALARVTGFGEAPEGMWVATAEVEGTPLRGLIDQGITPMRSVRLLGEVADGIDAAHRAGVSHGDIRAENVIVRGRPVEHAVLTGFPVNPDGAEPRKDIGAVAALLRECVPDVAPADADESDATAAALVAGTARALLYPQPSERPAPKVEHEAPAPPERERRRGRGMLKAAGALIVIAAAAAGGYALSQMSEPDAPAAARALSAGPLTVTVPPGWERAAAGRGLPQLQDGVTLQRGSPAGAIAAGVASDRNVVLDPTNLVDKFSRRASRPRPVDLGRLTALRFDGLRGDGPSAIYVASTSRGAPAVVCSGSDVSGACAQAAAGLDLKGARPHDPAAGIAWKNRLASDMRRLRARKARALRRLRAADTPDAQAGAANGIARAHVAAARSIRGRDAPPQATGARRRVLARLLDADRAYRSLARAAGATDEAAFRRAQRRVRRADRRLRITLRSL